MAEKSLIQMFEYRKQQHFMSNVLLFPYSMNFYRL